MNIVSNVIFIISLLVIIYGIFAICIAIYVIFKGRDKLYRDKYEEFLQQKRRVKERLKRRQDDTG